MQTWSTYTESYHLVTLVRCPAVVVGYDFGTVPGIVHSDILQNEGDISLAGSQYLQQLSCHVKCTDLNFSIQSAITDTNSTLEPQVSRSGSISDKGQIEFDIKWYKKFNMISNGLLYHPVLLNFGLKDCPSGFILSKNQPYSCNCHTHLKDKGVNYQWHRVGVSKWSCLGECLLR